MSNANGRGRPQMLLVAALFLGPLIIAGWLYYGSGFVPTSTTNKGVLLQPIISLLDVAPESPLHAGDGPSWRLLYSKTGACDAGCKADLQKLNQIRLMLGKDMDRTARVFLRDAIAPDTVPVEDDPGGLTTITDNDLADLLLAKKPEELPSGGIYLIDPLGNLVMYFPPTLDPRDVVTDIKHLLRLSNIG